MSKLEKILISWREMENRWFFRQIFLSFYHWQSAWPAAAPRPHDCWPSSCSCLHGGPAPCWSTTGSSAHPPSPGWHPRRHRRRAVASRWAATQIEWAWHLCWQCTWVAHSRWHHKRTWKATGRPAEAALKQRQECRTKRQCKAIKVLLKLTAHQLPNVIKSLMNVDSAFPKILGTVCKLSSSLSKSFDFWNMLSILR